MVTVNGVEIKDIDGMTIAQYLATTEHKLERVAVEKNGDIVFKNTYDSVVIEDGDVIEVVSFVGGG